MNAWWKLDPLNSSNAPASPFLMKKYSNSEVKYIVKYQQQAAKSRRLANQADNNSDDYMLVSLILSMVLFFCGICGVTNNIIRQRILIIISIIILVFSLFFMFRLPLQF
ncbi:MAG TPA: hypothetical protein VN192_04345 [Flavobacterium sp.]|nr:hypothetical protein [Flavobacterium sp.]